MKTQNQTRKRGVTLIETVIALVIITFVTGAFVSMLSIFSKIDTKNRLQTQAIGYTESIVECFRYCSDENEFERALCLLDGGFGSSFSNGDITYKLEKTEYVINVSSDFTQNKLEVYVVSSTGNVINSLTYEKH